MRSGTPVLLPAQNNTLEWGWGAAEAEAADDFSTRGRSHVPASPGPKGFAESKRNVEDIPATKNGTAQAGARASPPARGTCRVLCTRDAKPGRWQQASGRGSRDPLQQPGWREKSRGTRQRVSLSTLG